MSLKMYAFCTAVLFVAGMMLETALGILASALMLVGLVIAAFVRSRK